MKITIEGLDYSAALDAAKGLHIERKLNQPALCQLWLILPVDGSLAAPLCRQRVVITGDEGTVYFTGYVAATPLCAYAGMGMEGARYRTFVQAVSDEILLDEQLMIPSRGAVCSAASTLIASLAAHTGSTALAVQGASLDAAVSGFVATAGTQWSALAGAAASQARAAYQAINGTINLTAIPNAVHSVSQVEGSLTPGNLSLTASLQRTLANDVTICGAHEPVAYVREYFLGDGVTAAFYLNATPYFQPPSQSTLVRDLFHEPTIDQRSWCVSAGASSLGIGAGGLAMQGGNGVDGETVLSWIDPIEMGGTLLLEAAGVTLAAGSAGIVAGLFSGGMTAAECVAGFQATAQQGSGVVALQPLVQGTPAGTPYTLNAANQYTLRLRVHCPEEARTHAVYRSCGDSGALQAGGDAVPAPGLIQMEIQEFVDGVGGMPVTLYDGGVASLPANCTLVAASSVNLNGSMRALRLGRVGSGWVTSTPAGGGPRTRRLGGVTEAAECSMDGAGKLTFFSGFIPAQGELIAVSYRTVGRAVGRAVNAASQAALAAAGLPANAAWIGSMHAPVARSSADCRNAALVLAQTAASSGALWHGSYTSARAAFAADVWPGDALALSGDGPLPSVPLIVRAVKISYAASVPDAVEYTIDFANEWAEDLAMKTSATVPADAWLPAPVAPTPLANLNALTVSAMSGSAVTIETGVTPPAGGGFEVRRRDFAFMPGEDPDLVLRSAQTTFTLTRESANDEFYLRMYDGATPPNYSEFSAALFFHSPLSS